MDIGNKSVKRLARELADGWTIGWNEGKSFEAEVEKVVLAVLERERLRWEKDVQRCKRRLESWGVTPSQVSDPITTRRVESDDPGRDHEVSET